MNKIKSFFTALAVAIAGFFTHSHFTAPNIQTNPAQVSIPNKEAPKSLGAPHITINNIYATPDELPLIKEASSDVNQVLTSDCFKSFIIQGSFTETNDMSNSQIYDTISKSAVTLNVSMFDGTWAQNHWSKTIGYENDGDPTVYMNRYFVSSSYDMADNMIHEFMHSLGFHHYQVKSSSVPYQANVGFEKCAPEIGIKN